MSEFDKIVQGAEAVIGGVLYKGESLIVPLRRSGHSIAGSGASPTPFAYVGTDLENDYTGTMFFSDTYFLKPGTVFDQSLATASLAFALACGNSVEGYEQGFRNIEKLLADTGFSNISHNEAFGEMSSLDTIGVATGTRRIGDHTLICASIRGIGYGSEWGANLLLGKGRYHQGFEEAANRVMDYLRSYISEKAITGKVKFWINGYSRSASVSNLVAGWIDDAVASGSVSEILGDGISIAVDDVYAYCFEPARTVVDEESVVRGPAYANIWNIINPNDVVPILITSCFGMLRFGTDVILPKEGDPAYPRLRNRMLEFYNNLPNRDQIGLYRSDYFHAVEIGLQQELRMPISVKSQVEFITRFNALFAESLRSREYYADNIQDGLAEVVGQVKSYAGNARLREALFRAMGENVIFTVRLFRALHKEEYDYAREYMRSIVGRAVRLAKLDSSCAEDISKALVDIMAIFKDFFWGNVGMMVNFVVNSKTIFFAHYPELIFAWMMSMDDNYVLE